MLEQIDMHKKNFSHLGKESYIKGELHLHGFAKISSKIEGDILMDEHSKLTIETCGSVQGTIIGYDVEIFGLFRGEIKSKGKVIIQPSATVSGNIQAKNLTIYPGATVNIDGNTL